VKAFIDADNRTWVVSATVDSLRRVKDLAGVDLLTGDGLAKVTDQVDLWQLLELWPNVLWALCLPQCQAAHIDQAAWASLLLADTEGTPVFDAAITATLDELACFFRKLGRRTAAAALEKILEAKGAKETELAQRTARTLEGRMRTELDRLSQQIDDQLTSILGPPSTESPESSESTPDHSPCGGSSSCTRDAKKAGGPTMPGSAT